MAKFLWWNIKSNTEEIENEDDEQILEQRIQESIPAFRNKGDTPPASVLAQQRGEGWEHVHLIPGFNKLNLGSFNAFYSKYINKTFENERAKIYEYRDMGNFAEVADVIEDATNESTQLDRDNRVIHLEIMDPALAENENIVSNLNKEFNNLFNQTIDDFPDLLWDMVRSYFIDGRVFYERIINRSNIKKGIVNIKKLPSDTMDYIYDPTTGKIQAYLQYLKIGTTVQRPKSLEEAQQRSDVVVFEP